MMTNEVFFEHLGWDRELIYQYLYELVENMTSVDPHYENINLYHAYFERLFRMVVKKCIKDQRNIVFGVLEDLAMNNGFVDKLVKFMHK